MQLAVEILRLESELQLQRQNCRMDWRELHEMEKLIDLKIQLALARHTAALMETAHPQPTCPARDGGASCIC